MAGLRCIQHRLEDLCSPYPGCKSLVQFQVRLGPTRLRMGVRIWLNGQISTLPLFPVCSLSALLRRLVLVAVVSKGQCDSLRWPSTSWTGTDIQTASPKAL